MAERRLVYPGANSKFDVHVALGCTVRTNLLPDSDELNQKLKAGATASSHAGVHEPICKIREQVD